jgi:hypothetical protein
MPHRSLALETVHGVAILLVMLAHRYASQIATADDVDPDLVCLLPGFLIGDNLSVHPEDLADVRAG